jgi:hypothetical protein
LFLKELQDHVGSRFKISLDSLLSMVKSLSVQLGRRFATSEFATIWGAVQANQDGLAQLAKAVAATAIPKGWDRLMTGIEALPSTQYVDDSAAECISKMKTWVELFVGKNQPDLTELLEHKQDMEQVVSEMSNVVAPLPSCVTDHDLELSRLQGRLALMEKELQAVGAGNTATAFGFQGASSSSGTDPLVQQQLDVINKMLQDLILRKDEMVVTYGGVSYRSSDDVTSWLKIHHPKYNYDLFFDPRIYDHEIPMCRTVRHSGQNSCVVWHYLFCAGRSGT